MEINEKKWYKVSAIVDEEGKTIDHDVIPISVVLPVELKSNELYVKASNENEAIQEYEENI